MSIKQPHSLILYLEGLLGLVLLLHSFVILSSCFNMYIFIHVIIFIYYFLILIDIFLEHFQYCKIRIIFDFDYQCFLTSKLFRENIFVFLSYVLKQLNSINTIRLFITDKKILLLYD